MVYIVIERNTKPVLLPSFFSIVTSRMLCNILMTLVEFFMSCKIHPLFHVVDYLAIRREHKLRRYKKHQVNQPNSTFLNPTNSALQRYPINFLDLKRKLLLPGVAPINLFLIY